MPINTHEQELSARIKDLEKQIKVLKDRKKFGLVWEDKPEEVVLQCDTNIPVLKEVKGKKLFSDNDLPVNILIEGDNYHSLSVLNYTHGNKADVVYADPPYNTGNKSWRYNNDYIEKEDEFRHSKWISYIHKRINLAKKLLKNTGVLIFAIDDYEVHTLRLLLDEIMGEDNRLGTITVVHNPGGRQDEQFFATAHEYMLIYAKDRNQAVIKHLDQSEEKIKDYQYSDNLGTYKLREYRRAGANSRRQDRPNLWYPIYVNPKTLEIGISKQKGWTEIWPIDKSGIERVWRWNAKTFNEKKSDYIQVKKSIEGYKFYVKERSINYKGEKPKTFWFKPEYSAVNGTSVLKEIFAEKSDKIFDFPKSPFLMRDILSIASDTDSTVVDFFAGSGTTGHAVLELNKQDGGNRKFILCTNNENKIAEEVTYERLKRAINGYKNKKGEAVEGLGSNLSYYKTDLVNIDKLQRISDESKIKVTHQAGEMIALREGTLNEVDKNDWWQIFDGKEKRTVIYFKEDKSRLPELIKFLDKEDKSTVLYIFGWGKNEYKNEYSNKNIRVEDIPEPIIEVYKEINRI